MSVFQTTKMLYEKRVGEKVVQVMKRGGRRELRFGNHIVQSAVLEAEPETLVLEYTQAMMGVLLFGAGCEHVLQIGLGAGSIPRFIHHHFRGARQLVVEIQPEVVEVAYRYFFLPVSPRLAVETEDGEVFLNRCKEKFDLIFLDAYHADGVSTHLQTTEFFETAGKCLQPDGWLVSNVWGSDPAALKRVAHRLATHFDQMFSLSVGLDTNVIFFTRNGSERPSPQDILIQAGRLAQKMPLNFPALAKKLNRVHKSTNTRAQTAG